MNEEETKAITYLKFYIERDVMYEDTHYEQIKTILNLIDKQQKEIKDQKDLYEKLFNGYNKRVKEIEELKERQDYARLEKEQLLEDSINKDKIKAKIKEIENEHTGSTRNVLSVLKELLEE